MGVRRILVRAAFAAVLLRAVPVAAGTEVEPIARLTLDGGWDSNALYDGRSADETGRVSPEGGLRLHDPLWDFRGTYGGEWVFFRKLAPNGIWNHRGSLALDATPTRRTRLSLNAGGSQAFDPAGLAQAGVFRTGRLRAFILAGRGRYAYLAERGVEAAATFNERTVLFDDGGGGAMHQPGAEALWTVHRRVAIGAAYAFGVFQSFGAGAAPDDLATSHAARLRGRWRIERELTLNVSAGPALWRPSRGGDAVVPEGIAELVVATRGIDLHVDAGHGLGIGATAQPGLVDWIEGGGERRFEARGLYVRGTGGVWRSGTAPRGADAVTGFVVAGELGTVLGRDYRLALTASRSGRLGAGAPELSRTTVGVRLGWELPTR